MLSGSGLNDLVSPVCWIGTIVMDGTIDEGNVRCDFTPDVNDILGEHAESITHSGAVVTVSLHERGSSPQKESMQVRGVSGVLDSLSSHSRSIVTAVLRVPTILDVLPVLMGSGGGNVIGIEASVRGNSSIWSLVQAYSLVCSFESDEHSLLFTEGSIVSAGALNSSLVYIRCESPAVTLLQSSAEFSLSL